jgi:uncharacterized protein
MKLHAADTGRLNTVTGYGAGYVEINAVRHQGAILLMPEGDIRAWEPRDDGKLDAVQMETILAFSPEIVLLGTGPRQRLQDPQTMVAFHRAGVGLEPMDTAAACRTYNILMAEGRRVLAALMPF